MFNRPFFPYFSGLGLLIGLLYSSAGFTQAPAEETEAAFYLNLNQGAATTIHDLPEGALNIQYEDRLGSKPDLPLTVYNWKREAVAVYSLSKTYGSNYFRINLGDVFTSWKTGEIYTVEARDEAGPSYGFREGKPPTWSTGTC
jgi:hypothetical protein